MDLRIPSFAARHWHTLRQLNMASNNAQQGSNNNANPGNNNNCGNGNNVNDHDRNFWIPRFSHQRESVSERLLRTMEFQMWLVVRRTATQTRLQDAYERVYELEEDNEDLSAQLRNRERRLQNAERRIRELELLANVPEGHVSISSTSDSDSEAVDPSYKPSGLFNLIF